METYYEEEGVGPPLLFLHGGFGGVDNFAYQFHEFAEKYHVFAFERSGHGRTADTERPFTFQNMSEQAISFIETMGLGRSHLVGWSDGATVALIVALSRPDLAKSLVYISQNYNQGGIPPQGAEWIKAMTPESFRRDQPHEVEAYERLSPDGPSHFPRVVEKTKKLWLTEPNFTVQDLAKVSVPTLVMVADRDMIPIRHMSEVAASVKGAQFCVIPGATHFLLSEKPALVNNIILGFLEATNPHS